MRRLFVLACMALTLAGCGNDGPEVGKVSGTLTIDGEPASGIRVNFMPVDGGRASTGTTNEDGFYELVYSATSMGALPGKHNVSITPPEPPMDAGGAASSAPLVSNAIPQEYLTMKKQVEVEPGENTINLTYP